MKAAKINIEINFKQIPEAVRQLSPADKLKLNDVFGAEDGAIPIECQLLVAGRIKKARLHPETMLYWDEISKRLHHK